jgi:hypothetical protein
MPVTESSLRSAEEMLERAATSKQDRDRGPGRRE